MRIFYHPFLALALTALFQATDQSTPAEQPGVPPAAKRAYSEQERIALCKEKQNAPLAPSEPQPLRVEGKVTRPKVLRNVNAVYASPPIPGTVVLQVVIDEDGCVRDSKVLRGVNRYQDSAALDAIRQWVFLPATLEGKPVSVNYLLTMTVSRGYFSPKQLKQQLEGSVGWSRPADHKDEVFVFNVYRTGAEVLPKTIDGCNSLGSVYATVPEVEVAGSIGLFDPSVLLPTIKARAAHKSANTVVVSFAPGASESGRRTLRGTAFRCGDQPLPPELGEPLR
jgi:TonB family protein